MNGSGTRILAIWKQTILALGVVAAAVAIWVIYVPSALPFLQRMGVIDRLESVGIELAARSDDAGESVGGPGGFGGPVLVMTEAVEEGVINDSFTAIGTGRALRSVTLSPEVSGRLIEVSVSSGHRVAEGDVVARLDASAERIAVDRAELVLSDARETARRLGRLQNSGAASDVQIRDAELAVRQAELELREAEYQLSRRVIVAPFEGWVGLINVEPGNQVTSNTEITRIDDRSRLLVDFRIPERFVSQIEQGQELIARPLGVPDAELPGRVRALDNRVDPASRTLKVEAEIENARDTLRAGMAFSVTMRFDGDSYPSVPPLAIQWRSDGPFVWAARDQRARRVPVRIMQRGSDSVLVDADLEPGEQVVTEGVQTLRPDAELRIRSRAAAQADDAAPASES